MKPVTTEKKKSWPSTKIKSWFWWWETAKKQRAFVVTTKAKTWHWFWRFRRLTISATSSGSCSPLPICPWRWIKTRKLGALCFNEPMLKFKALDKASKPLTTETKESWSKIVFTQVRQWILMRSDQSLTYSVVMIHKIALDLRCQSWR